MKTIRSAWIYYQLNMLNVSATVSPVTLIVLSNVIESWPTKRKTALAMKDVQLVVLVQTISVQERQHNHLEQLVNLIVRK